MARFITRRRMTVAAVASVVLAGSAAAVTAYAGANSSGDLSPGQLSPKLGSVPLIKGTPPGVLTALAARLPLVTNPSVVAEAVPASPDPGAPGNAVSGLEVLCDLRVNSFQGSDISEALWERDLFTGAVKDEFAARGFGNVIDASATLVTPDGARQVAGGGVSTGVTTNQVFDPIPSNVGSTVANVARGVGLRSVKVEAMQVVQDVLVIHAVSDSPAADVAALRQQGGLQFLLGQSPMNFEGVYLEIDNSSGNPVYITDTAPRDGGGGWWADPSLSVAGELPTAAPSTSG